MVRRILSPSILASAVLAAALSGFAQTANASATIDLIWAGTGTNEVGGVGPSSVITLQVILTAGPNGSLGAGVSVDYSEAVGELTVLRYGSTPDADIAGSLPLVLGTTRDTGSRIENINSTASPPLQAGTGLAPGQSKQLGTVTFLTSTGATAPFEIRSDVNGPTDDVLDITGSVVSSTTTFNSALLCDAGGACPTPGPTPTPTPTPTSTPAPTSTPTPIPVENAAIDLIWDLTGSDTIADVPEGSDIRLNVILTAGQQGSRGGGVSVDYSDVLGALEVIGFMNTPSEPRLPIPGTAPSDTGSRIQNISSLAFSNLGTGLSAGQSHQLGTVTFHVNQTVPGASYEIRSDADGKMDDVLALNAYDITSTTTFNSAFLIGALPQATATPAPALEEAAAIELIWTETGTGEIDNLELDSEATLEVVLIAGSGGSQGASVSVDYGEASGLSVVSYESTPSQPYLPTTLGSTTDTGSRIENVNSAAIPFLGLGTGLPEGQGQVIGTVTFQVSQLPNGTLEIRSDANGSSDGVLDLSGNDIAGATRFGSAFLTNALPQATTTQTPQNECRCFPHRVVPRGKLAVLKGTQSLGRGSVKAGQVGVVLKAEERSRGACRPGSSTDTFSLRLQMVDDDGGVILDEIRTGLRCDRRVGREKFTVPYSVENCAGSEAPSRRSAGHVTLTATTADGELVASRTLECKP